MSFHHFAHVWMSPQRLCETAQHFNSSPNLGQCDLPWYSLWTRVLCTYAVSLWCNKDVWATQINYCVLWDPLILLRVCLCCGIDAGMHSGLGEGNNERFCLQIAPACSLTDRHGGWGSLIWNKFWVPYLSKKHTDVIWCCLVNSGLLCWCSTKSRQTLCFLDGIALTLRSVVYRTD